MALLNYTTKIDPDKTCAEIGKILSSHGAMRLMTEYDEENGSVSALSFQIRMANDQVAGFKLPCDWRPVYKILIAGKKIPWDTKRKQKFESEWQLQAVRTAWRIVKDWCEAQMALVETQMVKTEEVFLPYLVMQGGQTLAEKIQANPQFLLGSGE